MMPERLRELIEAGETLEIEFTGKARRALGDIELVESVICLANRAGEEPGWLTSR